MVGHCRPSEDAETQTLNKERKHSPNPVIEAWRHACQLQTMTLAAGPLVDARARLRSGHAWCAAKELAAMAGDEVQQRKRNIGLGKYWEGINTNTSWTKECHENFR